MSHPAATRRWRSLVGPGVLVLLGALAMWARGRAHKARRAPGHPVRADTVAGRNLRLARLGARAGSRTARHRARSVLASAARREELDRELEITNAADVAQELGHMKGALMKLGQMVSYLDEGLPENVRLALAELQRTHRR